MKKIDNLECYRIFCTIASCGSVREAGLRLSQEPSNLFRLIRQLEQELGLPLFERQSRPMRLTAQGGVFYAHALELLEEQRALIEALHENADLEAGLIRLASTSGVRHQILAPALVEYQQANPGISVELRDMAQGAKDIFAAADGTPSDLVLTYRTDLKLPPDTHVEELIDVPFIACAAPSYLRRRGTPATPADCAAHQGVLLKLVGRSSVSHLSKDGQYQSFGWQTTSTYSSQLDAVNALVLGAGICVDIALPYFAEKARQGLLAEVLPDWHCPPRTVCLFATGAAWRKRCVRIFAEWIAQRYRSRIREDLKFIRKARAGRA